MLITIAIYRIIVTKEKYLVLTEAVAHTWNHTALKRLGQEVTAGLRPT